MSVIYVVLPLALVIVGAAVWAYVWAAKHGQFDDMDTPALRVLREDEGTGGREQGAGGRGEGAEGR